MNQHWSETLKINKSQYKIWGEKCKLCFVVLLLDTQKVYGKTNYLRQDQIFSFQAFRNDRLHHYCNILPKIYLLDNYE